MEKSDKLTNLIKGMSLLKSQLKQPDKNKQGYGYKYATLDKVIAAIEKARAKTGIDYEQNISTGEDGAVSCQTYVFHETGEFLFFDPITVYGGRKAQDTGSSITYARRYSLQAAFGIAAEEDDDGQRANDSYPNRKTQKSSQRGNSKYDAKTVDVTKIKTLYKSMEPIAEATGKNLDEVQAAMLKAAKIPNANINKLTMDEYMAVTRVVKIQQAKLSKEASK